MLLAMLNGILTSIALESLILKITRKLRLIEAVKIAMGMSLISMISMELAMNVTDYYMTGGALITLKVLPIMWLAGFIVPLPYNYWRLKVLGKACH